VSDGFRVQHAEQYYATIVKHLDTGDVLVRQFDGVERTIDAAEAWRIAKLSVGSLVEYEWRYAAASRTNAASRAKPLGTEFVPAPRR
jgi:hypothetical protein